MDNAATSDHRVTKVEKLNIFPARKCRVGCLFLPIGDTDMQKVRAWGFYNLGGAIHAISGLKAGTPLRDIDNMVYDAWYALIDLKVNPLLLESFCQNEREALERELDCLSERCKNSPDDLLGEIEAQDLSEAARKFENVLESRLSDMKIYYVSQTEWFSTDTLVEQGEKLLPSKVSWRLSDYAKNEMRQAGRCIAFELPSAAGFHIIRTLESVIRDYYDVVTNGKARPKNESMGVLIAELEKEDNADKLILSALRQIKDLHRNPYIHDVVMTMKEVVILLGITQSAIAAIGDAIIKAKENKNN